MRLLRGRTWMLFVDGENFSKRGQAVLKAAGVDLPIGDPRWQRDVFLWPPVTGPDWSPISGASSGLLLRVRRADAGPPPPEAPPNLRRAYFYTSRSTGEPEWTDTQLAIRQVGFEPRLFPRKPDGRSKAVDIALATDVLTLGAGGQYEAAVIVAGDGDYVPVIDSVKRLGLHVGVAFVSNGISPQLRIAADEYVDLTEHLVRWWRDHLEAEGRRAAEDAERIAEERHGS